MVRVAAGVTPRRPGAGRPGPARGGARPGSAAVEESAYGEGPQGGPLAGPAAGRWARSRSRPAGPRGRRGRRRGLDDPAPPCRCSTNAERAAFVEAVAAESGRLPALLAGDLPLTLVEHAEEAGVELLPYGGELEAACTCSAWVDPCAHALAAAYQVAWLVDPDPLVLLALRGLSREELLARLHDREERRPEVPDDDDVALAVDAATRATRILQLLEAGRWSASPLRS